jgi:hypothetical protein
MRAVLALFVAVFAFAAGDESGFVPLFDGKTLNGWQLIDGRNTQWVVEEGMIVCPTGGRGKLLTKEQYGNFVLRLDYRIAEPAGNNGVNIRAALEGRPAYVGMEIQILDVGHEKWKAVRPEQQPGSIYDVIPARTGFQRKQGEWNEQEITANGRRITVKLNGVIVLDVDLGIVREKAILDKHPGLSRAAGHIGFLGHGTRTEFRNVRLKKLP